MKLKPNYVIIPVVTILAMYLSISMSRAPLMDWYPFLKLPELMPSRMFFAFIWNVNHILVTIAALLVWNSFPQIPNRVIIMALFAINVALTVTLPYIFLVQQLFGPAVAVAILLDVSIIGLIIYIYPQKKSAAVLLLPYFAWVSFITYMLYSIALLN